MGTSSGSSRRGAYAQMVAAGVENAMAKGWLFGRPTKNRREVIPDRGKVIWPDPPQGFMRHWWRATQTGNWYDQPNVRLVRFDIESQYAKGPESWPAPQAQVVYTDGRKEVVPLLDDMSMHISDRGIALAPGVKLCPHA